MFVLGAEQGGGLSRWFHKKCKEAAMGGFFLEGESAQDGTRVIPSPTTLRTMNSYCGAPGCSEVTTQRCSTCKSIRYCSRECQRRDWSVGGHKERCADLAQQRRRESSGNACRTHAAIVSIFDQQVTEHTLSMQELPPTGGGNGWHLCPVVKMLGVPLAIRKVAPCGCQMCVGSHSTIPESRNQVATRLAIEPHNGLAPPPWQGGPYNHLGTVVAARTDGEDFTVKDWQFLDNYIYSNIFDVWGMETAEREQHLPVVCSKRAYTRYLAVAGGSQEQQEEAAYGATFGGGGGGFDFFG